MSKQKNNQEWFTNMVGEIEAIMTETRFSSQETIIRGKHAIGEAIASNEKNGPVTEICSLVAGELGVSKRTVEQSLQFYKSDPSLKVLEQGKDISWRKILKTLQEPRVKEEKKVELEHMWFGKPLSECKKKELIECVKYLVIQLENSSKKLKSEEYYKLDGIKL